MRDAGSAFIGWKFTGGNELRFEVTPIVGALFGAARGVFAQLIAGHATLGICAFNPDSGSRYVIVSLGAQF